MKKKELIKNTVIIALLSQISKLFGICRELLMLKIMGVGFFSDAFLTAYKIPTTLRKIMAEGALSNTVIPHFSTVLKKNDKDTLSGLASLTFLILQSCCFIITVLGIYYSRQIIFITAPGFDEKQIAFGANCLRIFMPFTFFITGASLLASVLQSTHQFIIPASMPLTLNIFFIATLLVTYYYHGSMEWICWGLVIGSFIQLIIHIVAYYSYGFTFRCWNYENRVTVKKMLKNFLMYLPTISFSELNLFIDTYFASTLEQGTVSLLYYANRFMGIPLGVIIGSFATVLLPTLSKFSSLKNNRYRISLYLHNAIIFILWITIPLTGMMLFCSTKLFTTLFLSEDFSLKNAYTAGNLLSIFSCGLICLSINRILLNVFYALKNTYIPTIIALISLLVNCIGNYFLIERFGSLGLAFATTMSAFLQMLFSYICLQKYYKIGIKIRKILVFLRQYSIQLIITCIPFGIAYCMFYFIIRECFPLTVSLFLVEKVGYWLWTGPLCIVFWMVLWWFRTLFDVHLFFIE